MLFYVNIAYEKAILFISIVLISRGQNYKLNLKNTFFLGIILKLCTIYPTF